MSDPILTPVVQTVWNEAHQMVYFLLGSFITYQVMIALSITKKPKCTIIHEFNGINRD